MRVCVVVREDRLRSCAMDGVPSIRVGTRSRAGRPCHLWAGAGLAAFRSSIPAPFPRPIKTSPARSAGGGAGPSGGWARSAEESAAWLSPSAGWISRPVGPAICPVEQLIGPAEPVFVPVEALIGPVEQIPWPVEQRMAPVGSISRPGEQPIRPARAESRPIFWLLDVRKRPNRTGSWLLFPPLPLLASRFQLLSHVLRSVTR
jgi:hypothetical protein